MNSNSHEYKAIGILGGTFDPIHDGHLRLGMEVYQSCQLAEVKFIPCFQPVHRHPPEASPQDRLAMVKLAIQNERAFSVDTCEIDRGGPSYSIDTLQYLKQKFPGSSFSLILGIDALLGFTHWHQWQNILKLAHLIIAHRPQYQLPNEGAIAELIKAHLADTTEDLHLYPAGKIVFKEINALDISATQIRNLAKRNQNPRFLLPDKVYEYIQEHKIYSK